MSMILEEHERFVEGVKRRLKRTSDTPANKSETGALLDEINDRFGISCDRIHPYELVRSGLVDSTDRLAKKATKRKAQRREYESEGLRAQRVATYERAKKEFSFWDGFIRKQNEANSHSYPLTAANDVFESVSELGKISGLNKLPDADEKSDPVTSLIKEASKMKKGSKESSPVGIVVGAEDELVVSAYELRKLRQQTEKIKREGKRIKKIKSRNFHRLKRKLKAKRQPIRAEGVTQKDRMEERLTLKHTKVNRKLRRLAQHAKYDPEARQLLHEHRQLGLEKRSAVLEDERKSELQVVSDKKAVEKVMETETKLDIDPATVLQMLNYWNVRPNEVSLEDIVGVTPQITETCSGTIAEQSKDCNKCTTQQASNTGQLIFEEKTQNIGSSKVDGEDGVEFNEQDDVKNKYLLLNKEKHETKDDKVEQKGKDKSALCDRAGAEHFLAASTSASCNNNTKRTKNDAILQRKKEEHIKEKKCIEITDKRECRLLDGGDGEFGGSVNVNEKKEGMLTTESSNKSKMKSRRICVEVSEPMWAKEFPNLLLPESKRPNTQEGNDLYHSLGHFEREFNERKRKVEAEPEVKEDVGIRGLQAGWLGPLKMQQKSGKKRKENLRKIKRTRDMEQPHVIMNHKFRQCALKKHQVKRVPFPFKSITDYEEMVKQPLGKLWIPETAFRRLNNPKVNTLLGACIEPPRIRKF